jgi:hypothetical protein
MQKLFTNSKYSGRGRKGAIIDAIPIMIYMFIFAIVVVISFTIYRGFVNNGFFTILNANNPVNSSATNTLQDNADSAYDMLDFSMIVLYVGSMIAAIVSALLLRSHPAFFFIGIFAIMIQILVAVALSNTWSEIINNSNFAEAKAQFTITDFFVGQLPIVVLITTMLLSIVLYAINPLGLE